MAQVPTVEAPSVPLSGSPLDISAPATAFGANVLGDAAKNAGAAVQQGATMLEQHAQAQAELNGKAASDVGYGDFVKGANLLNSKFTALRGQDAILAYPKYQTDLEALRQANTPTYSPNAASYYNQETRRVLAGMDSVARGHADTQQQQYIKDASAFKVQGAMQNLSANPSDETLTEAMGIAREEYSFQAHLALGETADPAAVSGFVQQKVSEDFTKVLKGMSSDDPIAAWHFARAHQDLLYGQDRTIVRQLQRAAIPQMAAEDADGVIKPLATGTAPPQAAGTQAAPSAPKGEYSDLTPAVVQSNLRTDPAGFIQSVTGIGVRITSGARTPGQNAAAGGAVNSEHLSNNAWDMVPTGGETMVQLARAIHDSGIPYDQLEVTPTHVHVGLRDSGERQETIGPLAGAVGGAGGVGGNPPGVPPNSVQFRAGLEASLQQVPSLARARFPDDAQAGDRAVYEQTLTQAIMSRTGHQYDALRDTEANTVSTVLDYIDQHNVTDPTQLPADQRAALAALPPQTAHIAESSMRQNSRVVTPEQQPFIDQLRGEHAIAASGGDRSAFLNEDIPAMARAGQLPPRVASSYMAQQAKIRTQQAATSNQAINSAMASAPFKSALDGFGIQPNTPPYWQFVGRLQSAIDDFSAHNGNKPPTPKELPAIIAGVSANTQGGTSGLFGVGATAPVVVPQDKRDAIYRELVSAGLTHPTEADIGRIYEGRHRAGRY